MFLIPLIPLRPLGGVVLGFLAWTFVHVSVLHVSASSALAQSAAALNILVDAHCEGRTAAFEIENQGPKWPATAQVRVIDLDTKEVFSERRMRFGQGQRAMIRLKDADRRAGRVALVIEPSWVRAKRAPEATIDCRG